MDDNDKFLHIISQIESSGGKNINHKPIKTGVSKGETAIGQYGLTPATVNTLKKKQELSGGYGPDENLMDQMDSQELKDFMEANPRIENKYAQQNASRLLKKSGGDMDKAALMWNKGPNVDPSELESDSLDQNDYVNKFRNISSMLGSK